MPSAATVDRIAWSIGEVAQLHGMPESRVRRLIAQGCVAHVRLSPGRVLVVEGDVVPQAPGGDDGRGVLARAFAGRRLLRLHEVAAALGVSRHTLWRLASRGLLPARFHKARDCWQVDRDKLVRWLLERRVPSSAEVAT